MERSKLVQTIKDQLREIKPGTVTLVQGELVYRADSIMDLFKHNSTAVNVVENRNWKTTTRCAEHIADRILTQSVQPKKKQST